MDSDTAQKILSEIFAVTADYRFTKPIVGSVGTDRDGAYYLPSKHTIYIEDKTFDACRRMDKDSLNALAFIIGHELAHSYQEEIVRIGQPTSFLTYDKSLYTRTRHEKQADIHGAFGAYLAGYQLEVLPAFIDTLYRVFSLKGKHLPGYPDLAERQKTAAEVQAVVDELIVLFEFAQYLSLAGAYEYAAGCYNHILKYYSGSEIHNNLGVNYLLQALTYPHNKIDKYAHPIELDRQTQLQRSRMATGEKDINVADLLDRTRLLEGARRAFTEAFRQDPGYNQARMNLFTTLNLLGKPQEALDAIALAGLDNPEQLSPSEIAQLNLITGISYALLATADPDIGNKARESLKQSTEDASWSPMSHYNLAVLEGGWTAIPGVNEPCPSIPLMQPALDLVPDNVLDDQTHLRYGFRRVGRKRTLSITSGDGPVWYVQCDDDPGIREVPRHSGRDAIKIGDGSYLRCMEEKVAMRTGDDGVLSLVRWSVGSFE